MQINSGLTLIMVILFSLPSLHMAQNPDLMSVSETLAYETVIDVHPDIHEDYGLTFPLTYKFEYSALMKNLRVFKKYQSKDYWTEIEKKTSEDFFNGIEAARFDTTLGITYISVGFGEKSDSIIIKIVDADSSTIPMTFVEICKFYDDRDAAVTCSADDWAGWSANKFDRTIGIFRSYNLWLSCGIVTDGCNVDAWQRIQTQLDSGLVEACSHSRSHPYPYSDYNSEITGSRQDILNNVNLPASFKKDYKEYLYTFIAPNGYNDAIIDSLVGINKYLVNRLYYPGYTEFAEWNDQTKSYFALGVTRAFDPPRERLGWGIGTDDSTDLNNAFDEVMDTGGVYHLMCHPNVVEWDSAYVWSHLDHISNKKNVWYVSMGHLYMYHMMQSGATPPLAIENNSANIPENFSLEQNYPNPFNPSTTIPYRLANPGHVTINIYDALGRMVENLVDQKQPAGSHKIIWNARNHASGIYFYRINAGGIVKARKMLLVR